MIFDTHIHLNVEAFQADLPSVLENARSAGVGTFLNVGIDFAHSRAAVEFASKYENIYATVGLHPHDARQFNEKDFEELKALTHHPKVKAIGEIGLDYFRNLSPKEVQQKAFARFVELSGEVRLPLVIHSREAYSDVYSILKTFGAEHKGLMHCFSGTREDMEEALKLGLYISFAGPVTYKKNHSLRELVKAVPKNRLLVETDAPYLPPEPYRGKRNEPSMIVETVKKIAEVRGQDIEAVIQSTEENAKTLFHI
ncbi:MAG: TatD family hydrolase [Candidatus Omnitrophica bacterium]|nr:TatD family hydrolase [Candidatus Omnitrophota bacterium]